MKKERYNVAVVGATGVVGAEMIKVLEERKFPVERLKLLASERSIGKEVEYNGEFVTVEVLEATSFEDVDVALFSAGGAISREFAPLAARSTGARRGNQGPVRPTVRLLPRRSPQGRSGGR